MTDKQQQGKDDASSRFAPGPGDVTITPASAELQDSIRRWRGERAARRAAGQGGSVSPIRPRDSEQQ